MSYVARHHPLKQLGLSVPRWFCITPKSYKDFTEHSGIAEDIDTILATIDKNKISSIQHAAQSLRSKILTRPLLPRLQEDIVLHYELLNNSLIDVAHIPVVVSYATHQFVASNATELIAAVRSCWALQFTARNLLAIVRGKQIATPVVEVEEKIDSTCEGTILKGTHKTIISCKNEEFHIENQSISYFSTAVGQALTDHEMLALSRMVSSCEPGTKLHWKFADSFYFDAIEQEPHKAQTTKILHFNSPHRASLFGASETMRVIQEHLNQQRSSGLLINSHEVDHVSSQLQKHNLHPGKDITVVVNISDTEDFVMKPGLHVCVNEENLERAQGLHTYIRTNKNNVEQLERKGYTNFII